MPRDDLTIDFVKKMPTFDTHDPAIILDDWFNRVQNLPEEIRFMQEEIADKDRQCDELIRGIEERDAKLQRWIKINGSHVANPKEDVLTAEIRQSYDTADKISAEKILLTQRLSTIYEKHLRNLDAHIKQLYDRGEPGFTDADELPSLLRDSAANRTEPLIRTAVTGPSSASITAAGPGPSPLNPSHAAASSSTATSRPAVNPSVRLTQQSFGPQASHAASAPATPGATIILNRQRESSAGPSIKRGPRSTATSGNVAAASSSLARHSSLGPGTSKGGASGTGGGNSSRAGSAGPRTGSVKAASNAATRRPTPTAAQRKKTANKSSLSRVQKASARASPTSTGDSDLSEAESTSDNDDDDDDENDTSSPQGTAGRPKGVPTAYIRDAGGDVVVGDAEDDDEGSDDKKYCLCHNVSYGDMVACDNDDCPYEWFHWSCVGLESEPNGTWYCPECSKNLDSKNSK